MYRPNKDVLCIWKNRLGYAINIMDNKSRGNEGDNSQLLWNDQFDEVRNEIFEVMEFITEYLKDNNHEE